MTSPITGRIWHFTDLHFDAVRPPWGADGSAGIIPAHTDEIAIDSEIRLLRDHHLESRKPDLLLFGGDFVEAQSVPRTTRLARVNRLARLLGKINQKWGTGSASSAPTAVITAREARAQTFVYAAGVVRRIAEEVGLGDRLATRVVVCPGNHDVDRQQSAGDARKNLDDFYTAFADFVTPRSDPPFVKDDSLGICLLPLDTAFLGGAMMGNGQAAHPEDVSIFSLRGIREALAQLMKPRGRTAVPEGHLGIVLSHHPPGSTPTEFPDARAFDTAIAAEQAKDELFRAGFRVFLHGHKHVAVAQTESVRRGNSTSDMIVLGAANYGHQKFGSRGFSVIEYAVSRLCGEARLRVQPYVLSDGLPQKLGEHWLLTVAASDRSEIGSTRLLTRINGYGGTRVDLSYHQMRVPADAGDGIAGWSHEGDTWVRTISRIGDSRGQRPELIVDTTRTPRTPHSTARYVPFRDGRDGETIEIRVPDGERIGSLSVVSRWRAAFGHATTRAHQKRIWGSAAPAGLADDHEAVEFIVQEPTEKLELEVRLPTALPAPDQLPELSAFTIEPDGSKKPTPELLRFSEYVVEAAPFIRSLTAVVRHPIVGVGYRLSWQLPEDPNSHGVAADEYHEILRETERVRKWLYDRRMPVAREAFHDELLQACRDVQNRLLAAEMISAEDDFELALFLPDQPLWTPPRHAAGRPHLVPVWATYGDESDKRWAQRWAAGEGVAGCAYAVNDSVGHFDPTSGLYPASPTDEWMEGEPSPYVEVPGLGRHSILYAYPIYSPWRITEADLSLGCLCVGTYLQDSEMSLDESLPEAGRAESEYPAASVLLVRAVFAVLERFVPELAQG